MPPIVRQILLGLFAVFMQWLIFGRLTLWGTYPDVVLLFLAYFALQFGRMPGMFAGFITGFMMDAIYGTWGSQMFVKTLVGFLVGLAPTDERTQLFPQQVFSGALILALFHNGILVIFYVLETGTRSGYLIWGQWIGAAVYTAAVGTVITLLAMRR